MSWNYRIVKESYSHTDGVVEDSYSIKEVYYENDIPKSWTVNDPGVISETIEGCKEVLLQMQESFNKPILVIVGNKLIEEKYLPIS